MTPMLPLGPLESMSDPYSVRVRPWQMKLVPRERETVLQIPRRRRRADSDIESGSAFQPASQSVSATLVGAGDVGEKSLLAPSLHDLTKREAVVAGTDNTPSELCTALDEIRKGASDSLTVHTSYYDKYRDAIHDAVGGDDPYSMDLNGRQEKLHSISRVSEFPPEPVKPASLSDSRMMLSAFHEILSQLGDDTLRRLDGTSKGYYTIVDSKCYSIERDIRAFGAGEQIYEHVMGIAVSVDFDPVIVCDINHSFYDLLRSHSEETDDRADLWFVRHPSVQLFMAFDIIELPSGAHVTHVLPDLPRGLSVTEFMEEKYHYSSFGVTYYGCGTKISPLVGPLSIGVCIYARVPDEDNSEVYSVERFGPIQLKGNGHILNRVLAERCDEIRNRLNLCDHFSIRISKSVENLFDHADLRAAYSRYRSILGTRHNTRRSGPIRPQSYRLV